MYVDGHLVSGDAIILGDQGKHPLKERLQHTKVSEGRTLLLKLPHVSLQSCYKLLVHLIVANSRPPNSRILQFIDVRNVKQYGQ